MSMYRGLQEADLEPSSIVLTEYSTFTYYLTSLIAGETVTKTDIIVSSNVVTQTQPPEATPSVALEPSPSPRPTITGVDFETKTYFTTSTYYSTLVEGSRTLIKTRTKIKTNVVTAAKIRPTPTTTREVQKTQEVSLVPGKNEYKYLSLGPNIFGKVKTHFQTYTFFTTNNAGAVTESKKVVTQVSTSLFSTSALPASITLDPSTNNGGGRPIQLSSDELFDLKSSFLAGQGQQQQQPTVRPTQPGPSIGFDTDHLSSLKNSFTKSSLTATRPPPVITDINLPEGGPGIIIPPGENENKDDLDFGDDKPDINPTPTQQGPEGGNGGGGGVIDNVVGGIAAGLGGVNLGPVLDAVATLLRGPIRSAIANKRNDASRKVDDLSVAENRIRATAALPNYARLPPGARDPAYIPVGGAAGGVKPPRLNYEFIPLHQQKSANRPASLPYRSQEAVPRIDVGLEVEADGNSLQALTEDGEPVVRVPPDVYEALKRLKGAPDPVILDDDRLIINDHIIKSTDPAIVDVLNRVEQSHLFGRHHGSPMSIRILPGLPMNLPKRVQDDGVVYYPPQQNQQRPPPRQRPPGPRKPGPPPPPRPNRPPPPPRRRPPPPPPPKKRPRPPYQPQGPRRPPPPPPPAKRPQRQPNPAPRPQQIAPIGNDLDDSAHEFSINNEVVIRPPDHLLPDNQGNRYQRPVTPPPKFQSPVKKFPNAIPPPPGKRPRPPPPPPGYPRPRPGRLPPPPPPKGAAYGPPKQQQRPPPPPKRPSQLTPDRPQNQRPPQRPSQQAPPQPQILGGNQILPVSPVQPLRPPPPPTSRPQPPASPRPPRPPPPPSAQFTPSSTSRTPAQRPPYSPPAPPPQSPNPPILGSNQILPVSQNQRPPQRPSQLAPPQPQILGSNQILPVSPVQPVRTPPPPTSQNTPPFRAPSLAVPPQPSSGNQGQRRPSNPPPPFKKSPTRGTPYPKRRPTRRPPPPPPSRRPLPEVNERRDPPPTSRPRPPRPFFGRPDEGLRPGTVTSVTTERSINGRPPFRRPPRQPIVGQTKKPYTPIDRPTTGPLGNVVKPNPNKARKPSPIPVIGGGNFQVDEKKVDGPEIDPSFTSAHGRPTDIGSSATVGLVKRPETNRLDYQVRITSS